MSQTNKRQATIVSAVLILTIPNIITVTVIIGYIYVLVSYMNYNLAEFSFLEWYLMVSILAIPLGIIIFITIPWIRALRDWLMDTQEFREIKRAKKKEVRLEKLEALKNPKKKVIIHDKVPPDNWRTGSNELEIIEKKSQYD